MHDIKLAIHYGPGCDFLGSFAQRWLACCQDKAISYKLVNCYADDIVAELTTCDGLLWHFSHADSGAYQIAIKLLTAVERSGKLVFPNAASCWHFDDKVAQKYLLESVGAPLAPSHVFWSKEAAEQWIERAEFPIVAKLRGGAASANVRLLESRRAARTYVRKAFRSGFRQFDRVNLFRRSLQKMQGGRAHGREVVAAFAKLFVQSEYERVRGRERGYAYFQEYLPDNPFDIRVVVIGRRAFSIKRLAPNNDFRASGSGIIKYDRTELDDRCAQIAFDVTSKIQANCLTFDFLYAADGNPLIVEISYGFVQEVYDPCTGYWDDTLTWREEKVVPQWWMIEDLLAKITESRNGARPFVGGGAGVGSVW